MSRKKRSEDTYPMFRALGSRHDFLDAEGAASADRDTRIKSIWPFIVRRAREFHKSLSPKERVNFDPEDLVAELWVALAAKDHKWEPERGKYITFAGTIINRELSDLREKARTVESPRNSSCRMKEYTEEEEAGTITPQRLKTANDIRRTGDGAQSIGGPNDAYDLGCDEDEEPVGILALDEEARARHEAIRLAIQSMTPAEAIVMGRLYGLWGRPRESLYWIAWSTLQDVSEVRKAKAAAFAKVCQHLLSIDHPATRSGA